MKKSTVCQMCYVVDNEGRPGMCFSDEIAEDKSRAFSYCLPIPRISFSSRAALNRLLFDQLAIVFPCSFRKAQAALETKCRLAEGECYFSYNRIIQGIAFQVEIESLMSAFLHFRNPNLLRLNRYVGTVSSLRRHDLVFLEVSPINVNAMDVACVEHDFVFVGQTKSFGNHLESIAEFG